MIEYEDLSKIEDIISSYIKNARLELEERWEKWTIDLSQNEIHEVVGALLARQVTLSRNMAENPPIWSGHSAPLILRAMSDVYISLAWVLNDPLERSRKFVLYGLGQAKLQLEHCKVQLVDRKPTPEEEIFIEGSEEWINSQRFTFLTEVNVGSWSGISTRQMAEEAGCIDFYNNVYNPFSACTHSTWHHIARYNLKQCTNPLHQYHQVPDDPEFPMDTYHLYLSAEILQKTFSAFDNKLGIKIEAPSAFNQLCEGLDSLSETEGAEQEQTLINKMVECCRVKLNLKNAALSDEYYYMSLPICIIDAVFSLGIRYTMTQKIVENFCSKVNINRFRPYGSPYPPVEDQFPVKSLIDLYKVPSFDEMVDNYFVSRHRTSPTSGILKSEAVYMFAKVLFSFGINYFQDLISFIGDERLENAIKKIPGQTSGKSLNYFYMLAGDENYIKPDRMIIRFIESCIGKTVNTNSASSLILDASSILSHTFPELTPIMLDHEIWKYQRSGGREVKLMSSQIPDFEEVWKRICLFEGDEFETKTGLPFTYQIRGEIFRPSRTDYNIAKSDFKKAHSLVPFEGPKLINETVRGPAYVWAVLHDRRVSKGDW